MFLPLFVVVALEEITVKASVSEQELSKANKVILKSKKAQEVQQLAKENESLKQKLSTQEEDFRHQNQTLLQELSKVPRSDIIMCSQISPISRSITTPRVESNAFFETVELLFENHTNSSTTVW